MLGVRGTGEAASLVLGFLSLELLATELSASAFLPDARPAGDLAGLSSEDSNVSSGGLTLPVPGVLNKSVYRLRSVLDTDFHGLEFGNLSAQRGDFCSQFVDFGGVAQGAQREICDLSADALAHLAFQNF